MDLIDVMLILGISLVSGLAGQGTSGFARRSWIMHMGLGLLGATSGVIISRSLKFPIIYDLTIGLTHFPILWAVLGAVFFVAGVGFFLKPRR